MRARAKGLNFGSRQPRWTINDDEIESFLHRVGMKNTRQSIAYIRRLQQVPLQTFHQSVTQIARTVPDALKQPFDHDAVVGLREVIVCGDDLQPAGAIKINVVSEKGEVDRRDIAADQ